MLPTMHLGAEQAGLCHGSCHQAADPSYKAIVGKHASLVVSRSLEPIVAI